MRPEIHSKEKILEILMLEQSLTILHKIPRTGCRSIIHRMSKQALVLVKCLQREPGQTKNKVTAHELGKKAVLLGGTAVAPGFKCKPVEPQPKGVFQKECWNIYRVLQEQLGWNTHKETQPVYERVVYAQQVLACSEQKGLKTGRWHLSSSYLSPRVFDI